MNIDKHLIGLARPALIETIYLAGRYLTHRLTKDSFLRQLKADVETPDRKKAVPVVLDIVKEIEKREGAAIEDLPGEKRFSYAEKLDDILHRRIASSAEATDVAEVDETLSMLRNIT